MIGPAGGNGFPNLHIILFVATLVVLSLAGFVVLLRLARRRRPVMGRSVRVLGVLAAVVFAWYLVDTADRREVRAAFNEVAESLELETYPGYSYSGRVEENTCRATGGREPAVTTAGRAGRRAVAATHYEIFEALALTAEADGWEVRRVVSSRGTLWVNGERGDVAFSAQIGETNQTFLVTVTTNDCRRFDWSDLRDDPSYGSRTEVDVFEP